MDLGFGEEHEAFRAEVKEFLEETWPLRGDEAKLRRRQQAALFRRRAIDRGYLARAIPRAYGGSEQESDPLRATIIASEFSRVHAPRDPGAPISQLIATLVQHGTEEQKTRFLPPTLTGEMVWCQGYSEPGAGSDLASIRTKAELVGDQWVIHGQKIWTSAAQVAHMMYLLCRTEPDAPKHAGMSYLLVDMKQPGIEVRPLRQMNGDQHFNEVFFDDARTPADHIVGAPGEGWTVSRSTLAHERNAVGGAVGVRVQFERLVALAREAQRDGRPAIEDPTIRQRLAEIDGYVTSHEYSGFRQLTSDVRGDKRGSIGMMNKLVSTEIGHMVAKLALDLLGDDGLRAPGRERGPDWLSEYMMSVGLSIAGGTTEIQRNIIGERALGLPRDFALRKT